MDEAEAEEGMTEAVVEIDTVLAAAAGTPMLAVLRPIARLLTALRPEGAETVAEPTEEAWGPPRDTCAPATATEEEEDTEEDCTAETEEGKEEEWRLESLSTLGCYEMKRKELSVMMKLNIH